MTSIISTKPPPSPMLNTLVSLRQTQELIILFPLIIINITARRRPLTVAAIVTYGKPRMHGTHTPPQLTVTSTTAMAVKDMVKATTRSTTATARSTTPRSTTTATRGQQ